jgi:iron complex outermembrane receptor protein
MKNKSISCALLAGLLATTTYSRATTTDEQSWPELSLGDLMKVGIESASRKSQSVSNTAASIFVISSADIRRSGALTIPEVLRLAPGVEAAKLGNNKWAVSIRGFNGRMANKLLVMVDGRSIYSSLYGGVVWESENLPLEDINRIEVIRGPAGVAWGSNAVNGVINIITKRAQDTAGWMIDGHGGTSTGKAGITTRFGSKQEDASAFRFTLDKQWRGEGKELNGRDAQDEWNDASLNFRYDKPVGADTRYFVSGRLFKEQDGDPWLLPTFNTAATYNIAQYGMTRLAPFVSTESGGDLLGRVERTTDGGGEVRIQTYVDHLLARVQSSTDDHTTLDFDASHHFPLGESHDIVWGGNYRRTRHHMSVNADGFLTTSSPDVTVTLGSLFVQDDWMLAPHRFNIQTGLRVEHQTYGGTSPQPSVRALWTPSDTQSFWLAWSKTVRSPNVVQRTMGAYAAAVPAAGTTPAILVYAAPGEQTNFGNEKVRTLEAGHRAQWTQAFYSDLSAYVSHYDGAFNTMSQSIVPNTVIAGPGGDPTCTAALVNYGLNPALPGLCLIHHYGNALPVRTRGLELATEWNASSSWRLQLNASRLWLDAGANTRFDENSLLYGSSPKYQSSLRSSYNITPTRHFDLWFRRIGGFAYTGYFSGTSRTPVNWRNELDLRLAEQVSESLELSLTLQNLLSKNQLQFYPDYMPSLPVVPQRTIYLKALWHGR